MKTCPSCGSIDVPYPLSTNSNCGDLDYTLRCDSHSQRLYFDALNGSSYPVLKINGSSQRLVIQPSPWVPDSCVTQDMLVSEGLWLNQSLPFNITSSNTIFLLNCSPRLLVSPLNCTPSSICHHYLERSGRVDGKRAFQCASVLDPCCTFIAGGMPSAYKIRLHNSGCRAFRSILHLDVEKPANQWEEGLEIQWAAPPEPICRTQSDCTGASDCRPTGSSNSRSRCLCRTSYHWDHILGTCLRTNRKSMVGLSIKLLLLSDDPSSNTLISVKHLLELALTCLREKKAERPSMKDVVQELEYIAQILESPETVGEEEEEEEGQSYKGLEV
ncbi:Wall-associated receptor kinase-like 20, partial [Cucurbita argyrosperma subsp. sororia]